MIVWRRSHRQVYDCGRMHAIRGVCKSALVEGHVEEIVGSCRTLFGPGVRCSDGPAHERWCYHVLPGDPASAVTFAFVDDADLSLFKMAFVKTQ